MARITVNVKSRPADLEAILVWPVPPAPTQSAVPQFHSIDTQGLQTAGNLVATNSSLSAQWAKPDGQVAIGITYEFADLGHSSDETPPPQDYWQLQHNRHTKASAELVEQVNSWIDPALSQTQQLHTLIHQTADMFAYGHVEQRFTEGKPQVPSLCGITNGSCVDINTYLIAAALNLGIKVQYLAGYWFHPSRSYTHDMHCWLEFETDGQRQYWDVAHHLKWGVDGLEAGLNPAGGRRWLMSYGRGLTFVTPHGEVAISHFAEPIWVLPDGSTFEPELHIELIEK